MQDEAVTKISLRNKSCGHKPTYKFQGTEVYLHLYC